LPPPRPTYRNCSSSSTRPTASRSRSSSTTRPPGGNSKADTNLASAGRQSHLAAVLKPGRGENQLHQPGSEPGRADRPVLTLPTAICDFAIPRPTVNRAHHPGCRRDHHRQRLNSAASRDGLARDSAAAPACWPGNAVLCVLLACWTPPGPGLVLLLCWPQRPRSAVAPALRTRPCHTGTRTRPRLSTPAISHPMRQPPEDRLPPATAGMPAIPLPPRPGRE
jgi:hypothetical protein